MALQIKLSEQHLHITQILLVRQIDMTIMVVMLCEFEVVTVPPPIFGAMLKISEVVSV